MLCVEREKERREEREHVGVGGPAFPGAAERATQLTEKRAAARDFSSFTTNIPTYSAPLSLSLPPLSLQYLIIYLIITIL